MNDHMKYSDFVALETTNLLMTQIKYYLLITLRCSVYEQKQSLNISQH